MTTDRTLRRKLQKKAKRKPYRKCPKCGDRMDLIIRWDGTYRLYKYCGNSCVIDGFKPALGPHRPPKVRAKGPPTYSMPTMFWLQESFTPGEETAGPQPWENGCGYFEELFWSDGGIGRHSPHSQEAGESPQGCAGSNPAPTTEL